jgi:hypothetical protein
MKAIARAIFRNLASFLGRAFGSLGRAFDWTWNWLQAVLFAVIGGALYLAMWGQLATAPPWLQLALGLALTVLTAWGASSLYVDLWRGEAHLPGGAAQGERLGDLAAPDEDRRRGGSVADAMLATVLIWCALTAPFAFATYRLDHEQSRAFTARNYGDKPFTETDVYNAAVFQYAWHAFDALPFVNATETLRWEEPLARYSPGTGALLLLYKLMVLAPLFAGIYGVWQRRHEPAATGPPDVAPGVTSPPARSSSS